MGRCAAWDVRHAGPYTFAESPKHVALVNALAYNLLRWISLTVT